MKKILVLVVLLIIVSGTYFYINKKTSVSPLSSQILLDQYDICTSSSEKYLIRDSNNSLVQEARKAFLDNTEVSEEYFNQHFTLGCAGEVLHKYNIIPVRYVFFNYSIGEYVAQVGIYSSVTDQSMTSGSIQFMYKGLKEIKNVISKETAINKLDTCMKKGLYKFSISLDKNRGLVMEGEGKPGFGTKWAGSLNLETGKCEASQISVDPGI